MTGAMGLVSACTALSAMNPRKGAHPVPGPTKMSGSDCGGAGREPLPNQTGMFISKHDGTQNVKR